MNGYMIMLGLSIVGLIIGSFIIFKKNKKSEEEKFYVVDEAHSLMSTLKDDFPKPQESVKTSPSVNKKSKQSDDRNKTNNEDDGDFLTSAAVAYATDSAIIGSVVGGSVAGAVVGDMLNGGELNDSDDSSSSWDSSSDDSSWDSGSSWDD